MEWTTQGDFRAPSGLTYRFGLRGHGPPLLGLHGFTGNKDAFAHAFRQLGQGWTWIGVDLPGHGGSAPIARKSASFVQVLSDCAALIRQQALGPAHCLGYSLGGRIALGLACRHADVLATLSLISASPGLAASAARRTRRAWDADLALFIQGAPAAVFRRYWNALPLFGAPAAPARDAAEFSPAQRQGLRDALALLGTGSQPSFWDELPQLNVPVRIIAGQRDRKYVRIAQAMQRAMPCARASFVPRAWHRPHLDAPDVVGALIEDHILQHMSPESV